MTYLCTFIYAFLVIACKKKETKCNCDTDDGEIGIDEGDLRTTDHLPVMKIVNTNAQRGSSTLGLGEFECFGDESKFGVSQAVCRGTLLFQVLLNKFIKWGEKIIQTFAIPYSISPV